VIEVVSPYEDLHILGMFDAGLLDRLATIYVTRDSDEGVLDDYCDVWVEQPERLVGHDCTFWIQEDGVRFSLSVVEVRAWLGPVPESDRECIVKRNPRVN
jgi:hypothetical protein